MSGPMAAHPEMLGSLTHRVIAIIVVTVSTLLSLAGVTAYRYVSEQARADFDQAQALAADQFQIALTPLAWNLDYLQIRRLMESHLSDPHLRIAEVDLGTQRLILGKENGETLRELSEIQHQDYPVVTRTLIHEGELLGTARLYISTASLDEKLARARLYMMIFIVLVALVLSLSLYLLIRRLVVGPLKLVERYADEISRGEPVPLALNQLAFLGELESLKASVDRMVRELGQRNTALQHSTERFERVIRLFPQPIMLHASDGRMIYLNDRFTEVFGYTLDDLPFTRDWLSRAYPDADYRSELLKAWRSDRKAAPNHGDSCPITLRVCEVSCANGETRSAEIGGIISKDLSIIMLADVTERMRAEQELARHREHLEELVNTRTRELATTYRQLEETQFAMTHAGIAIQWIDAVSGRLLYVNDRACALYGYSREILLAMTAGELMPEFESDGLSLLQQQLRQLGRTTVESDAKTREGLVPVETSIYLQAPVADQPGHFITFTMDIRQRKAAERALLAAKAAAESAARTRSEFLANMSHEIRTPMNAIIGMSQLALNTTLDERQRNYIEKVHLSAVSLLGILNDILDFSKVEAGQLQVEHVSFQLEQVLSNVRNVLSLRAEEKGLAFTLDVAPETPPVLTGDPMRLGQVLINLAGNAVKFTEHGHVSITVHPLPPDDQAGMSLAFTVSDTGIGISPEQQRRLFSAFSQADSSISRRFGGSGLGLAISKRLVELMGGEISVSSIAGQGSSFRFSIRVTEGVLEKSRDPAPSARNYTHLEGINILLVDDNAINQEIACELLSSVGARITVASHGEEALQKLEQASFDCVLMDVQMPVMDGLEATRRIRANPQYRTLPIIAMTAGALPEERAETQAAGMNLHITKPLDFRELLEAVSELTGHDTPAVNQQPPQSATTVPSADDPIDIAFGLRMSGGKPGLYRRLLGSYVSSVPARAASIEQALRNQDFSDLQRTAHTLKGSSSTLGLRTVTALAAELEIAAHLGDQPRIEALCNALHESEIHAVAAISSMRDTLL